MGMLVPLYLAGLTALSLPLILHLVRRTPRGRQEFSSLMFLSPTPPTLTRRSRLDQILLLLLRLAALALIALAFSRPFLREAALLTQADLTGKRVALLIDTSASMRRADLWQQAIKLAEKELDELNPQDDIALFGFSDRLRTIIDFQKEGASPIADKIEIVRNRLKQMQPDWNVTDLGTALVTVAGELDSATDVAQSTLDPQMIVISDFQIGSRIEALQSFEWPKRVPVVVRKVNAAKSTNAHAYVLPNEDGDESTDVRLRVVNANDSSGDNFLVGWGNSPVPVYVSAGQSQVIKLPRGTDNLQADRIVLRGDDHDFDNTFFVVPPRKLEATILYSGNDAADDVQGCQYYLKLAVANDSLRQVEVRALDTDKAESVLIEPMPQLVVVSRSVPRNWQQTFSQYVERGGMLLLIPNDDAAVTTLDLLTTDISVVSQPTTVPGSEDETRSGQFLLLGDIDFTNPIFSPFSNPRFSDFTKIHFWRHRKVSLKSPAETRVIARFDNGDPALLERTVGKGRVLLLTSGWQPDESQLALSSKFVPLIGSLLDLACGGNQAAASVSVGESVSMPAISAGQPIVIRSPDGQSIRVEEGHASFSETKQPGIYSAKSGSTETLFAVNLSPSESNTAPLDLEQLEQRGVRFTAELTRAERIDRIRQQRDMELEGQQKVWRWLIVMALATLILETWWAGRAERIARR